VFEVIYVSFLPVGHTHNGPDRIASRISNAVRRTDIHTEERFLEVVEGSQSASVVETPALVSDDGEIPELVSDDGETLGGF
jgi:hypothetical protein